VALVRIASGPYWGDGGHLRVARELAHGLEKSVPPVSPMSELVIYINELLLIKPFPKCRIVAEVG
jgi:hypothetical protein